MNLREYRKHLHAAASALDVVLEHVGKAARDEETGDGTYQDRVAVARMNMADEYRRTLGRVQQDLASSYDPAAYLKKQRWHMPKRAKRVANGKAR